MAFAVDANVLVYAAHLDSPESERCRALLDAWREGAEPWYLAWGVLYEFLRVVTHPRILRSPLTTADARAFVSALLASPSVRMLQPTERHPDVLWQTMAEFPDIRANDVFDLRTAVLMREHGIRRIVTRDRGFRRFPFLEVVDPLA